MSLHSNPSIKKSDKIQDKDIDYNVKMKLLEGGLTDFSENVRRQMKIDKAGQYMMSDAKDSEAIATEISKLPGLESKKIRITDACAGVGGNTLQFIFHTRFESVVAIEKDEERCNQFLNHNIKIAKTKSKKRTAKCDVRAVDYLSEIHKHEQDVVFFDPPWGAKSYCHHDEIALFLGEKHMAEIVADLYRNSKQNKTKYVVIKGCNNFAVDDMQRILGELCVGFQSKSSENCVEMLYSAKKRGRRGGGQKYPVYYIKIPDVVEEDKQMTYYDPQYIPISHGHCRIYLHLNNALQNLRYGGLFYIEEAIEQKSGLLGFLEQEWQQRDSDHVSIVLNIVQAMDKDVKGCDFFAALRMDTRANIEQFASLALHTKQKLDTYTEDNERNITPGDCYSQNISFLENKKRQLSNFMDELFTGNNMLLVYLIGKEHYPMILSVEKQEDHREKQLRLHHITSDALERFQSRFQESDYKRLIKDEQDKFATNQTSKQADLGILQVQSRKIFKYEAQHAYFDAMASANESHTVDNPLFDFLKHQYDWVEGDNAIEDLPHGNLPDVSEPARQILQKYQQEIGRCIQANQERNETLESEFKGVGSTMNPGELISTERGVRERQKKSHYSKQTRTKTQPEGTNSAMSVGSRQAPKRRQGAEKQNIRKAWKQFKRREINSSNLIQSGFTSTNQPNLFEFNTKLFYLHAFGKLMSEFLSMSIEKKLEKISEFFFASRYIPAARGEFMDLCCELYWQPALLRNTAGQYPEIYGAEQNDAMQLIKLYEEFQKNWRLLLCYRMHSDPGFAQSAKLRGFCPQYMKSKKLQSSIMEQKKLYTYPVLPTPKTDMKLIVTSTANDATVRASDFLWSNPNEQKKLVEKYAGRRMTFELDERVPSNDMIDKYYIDKFSKTFLKLHTNTIEQFNVEMLKICKSIYQMMYDVLALSDPQWGDKNPRETLFKIKDQVNSSLVKPSGPNAADVQGKAMKSDEIPPSPPKDLDITKFFNKAETSYDEQVQDKIEKILMQKKLTFMPYVENIVMECLKITKPDAKIKKTREDLLRDDAKSLKKIVHNISIWMAQTMEQSCEHDGTTRFWELANGEPEDSLLNRVIEVKPNQGLSIPRANAFTLHDTSLRNIFKKQENRSAGFFEREYKLLQANRKYRPFGLCWEKVPQSDKLGDDKIDALITEVQKLRNDISEEEKETPKNYMHRNFIELQLAFCVLKYPRIAVEEDDEYKYIVLEGSVPCKIKKTMIKRAQTIDGITRKITGVEYKPCIVPDGLKEIFEKRLQLFRNEWTTHGKEIIEQIENHRASLPDSEKWKARNIYLIDDTEGKECYYFPRNIVMDEYYSRAEPRFYREFITPFSPSTILKVQREDTVQYYFTPCYDSYFGRFSARTFFKWKNGIPVQEYREEELANLMVYLRQEVALAVKYRRNFYWFENRCLDLVWAVLRGVKVLDTGCEDIIQRVHAEGFSGDVENIWKSAHGTLLRRNFDRAGNHAAQSQGESPENTDAIRESIQTSLPGHAHAHTDEKISLKLDDVHKSLKEIKKIYESLKDTVDNIDKNDLTQNLLEEYKEKGMQIRTAIEDLENRKGELESSRTHQTHQVTNAEESEKDIKLIDEIITLLREYPDMEITIRIEDLQNRKRELESSKIHRRKELEIMQARLENDLKRQIPHIESKQKEAQEFQKGIVSWTKDKISQYRQKMDEWERDRKLLEQTNTLLQEYRVDFIESGLAIKALKVSRDTCSILTGIKLEGREMIQKLEQSSQRARENDDSQGSNPGKVPSNITESSNQGDKGKRTANPNSQTPKEKKSAIQETFTKLDNNFMNRLINTSPQSNDGNTVLDIMAGEDFKAKYNEEASKGDSNHLKTVLLQFLFDKHAEFLKPDGKKMLERSQTTQNTATDKFKQNTVPGPNPSAKTVVGYAPPITPIWEQRSKKLMEQRFNKAKSNAYSKYQFREINPTASSRFQPPETVKNDYKQKMQIARLPIIDPETKRPVIDPKTKKEDPGTYPWLWVYEKIIGDNTYNDYTLVDMNPDGNCLFHAFSFLANLEKLAPFGDRSTPWTDSEMREKIIELEQNAVKKAGSNERIDLCGQKPFVTVIESQYEDLIKGEYGDVFIDGGFFCENFKIKLDIVKLSTENPSEPILKRDKLNFYSGENAPQYIMVLGKNHFAFLLTERQKEDMVEKTLKEDSYLHKKHIKQYQERIWYYDDVLQENFLEVKNIS